MALDEERGARMHQKHDTVCVTNMGRERGENDGKHKEWHCSMLFPLCSPLPITPSEHADCAQVESGFHLRARRWQLWQNKRESLPVSTVQELYDLIESVFTVCPAPPGTEYINSISLAQPEYQHHRLDFTLPCLPESGPLNNIYTVCAYRKMMMLS